MGNFGVSTERFFYQYKELEPELIKMGKDLGLSGFGNVVFMYSEPEQAHYLIEIDVRPNAWMYYGRFTRNNFSEAIRKVIKGDLTLLQPDSKFANKKVKIRLYKKDLYRCLMEKDFKGFLAWIFNKDQS